MQAPLARSDEAYCDESVLGYALRMAEANRVNGLAGTARLLGCGSIVRGGSSHAAAIARLYGASPGRLLSLAPHQLRRDGALHVSLLGCELSRPWLLRSQRPQVCPRCLAEYGYARVDWELMFMTHCRLHWIRLLDQCPGCREALHWRRKTLKRCSCGTDLSSTESAEPCANPSAGFAAWLATRMGLPATAVSAVDRFDWQRNFEALSIDGALLLLWALGARRNAHDTVEPGRTHGPIATTEVVALIERAYDRLRVLGAESTTDIDGLASAVHTSALVSLAARGLTDGDRRLASQLLLRIGYRTWKSARVRDRSPHAQLELFEQPSAAYAGSHE